MCATPHGFHPCECLWEVPSGTRAETHTDADSGKTTLRLHYPNLTIEEKQPCSRSPPLKAVRPHSDPCALGFAHAAPMEAFYYTPARVNVTSFTANYVVPEPPAATASNVLYYWIGLQDRGSSANPVIQPVLSYVPGASANNWYFESWNCCPAGHKLKSTTVAVTGPGEVLHGSMHRDVSGVWTITSSNAAGQASILKSDDTNSGIVTSWDWLDIVLETYSVDACDQYSQGAVMAFNQLTLKTSDGQSLAPSDWTYQPYINGQYLEPQEAKEFTACCNGKFAVNWPSATMTQNANPQ